MELSEVLAAFKYWKNARLTDKEGLKEIMDFVCDVYGIDEEEFIDAYNDMVEEAA